MTESTNLIASGLSAGAGCLIGWTLAKETFLNNFNECFDLIKNNKEKEFLEKYGLISKDTYHNVRNHLNTGIKSDPLLSNTGIQLDFNSVKTFLLNAKSNQKLKNELKQFFSQNANLFVSSFDELKIFLKLSQISTLMNSKHSEFLDFLIERPENQFPPKLFNYLKSNFKLKFNDSNSIVDYIDKMNKHHDEFNTSLDTKLENMFKKKQSEISTNNSTTKTIDDLDKVLQIFVENINLLEPLWKKNDLDKLKLNDELTNYFFLKNESKIISNFQNLKNLNKYIIQTINQKLTKIVVNEHNNETDLNEHLEKILALILDFDNLFEKLNSQNLNLDLKQFSKLNTRFSSMYGSLLYKKFFKQEINISFDASCNLIVQDFNNKQREFDNQVEALKQNDEIFLLSSLNTYLADKSINNQVFTNFTLEAINNDDNRNNIVRKIYEHLFIGANVLTLNINYSITAMTNLHFLKFCYYCISKIKLNTFTSI